MLTHQYFLIALLVVNLFGTVYGYIWYESQLTITPIYFMLFVPDSPTATLFFTVWILFYLFITRTLYLFDTSTSYIVVLALTSLLKYCLCAVVMNVLTLIVEGTLSWQGYMLIASHGAMALQGLLYIPFYKFSLKHLTVAGIILLHND